MVAPQDNSIITQVVANKIQLRLRNLTISQFQYLVVNSFVCLPWSKVGLVDTGVWAPRDGTPRRWYNYSSSC